MIFDKLEKSHFYYGLSERIKTAFKYLAATDLLNLENGSYEIDGDNVFVIVQDYRTKPENEGKWEAHRNYIDIQYIIKGNEKLGYLNLEGFQPEGEYNFEKDIVFGSGKGGFLEAKSGDFVLFAPQDAHMPGLCVNEPEYVKKAVVKVKF